MQSLAACVTVSWGLRRCVFAFLAGAFSALSVPPFSLFPVLFLTFPVLVWLLDGVVGVDPVSGKLFRIHRKLLLALQAGAVGLYFGLGYFGVSFFWISTPFALGLNFSPQVGWLLCLPILFCLAFTTALGTFFAWLLWSRAGVRIFALAVGLTAGEWIREHSLLFAPLNQIGVGLVTPEPLMQIVSVVGIQSIPFLSVLIFASPAVLGSGAVGLFSGSSRKLWYLPVFSFFLLAFCLLYGLVRLPDEEGAPRFENVRLRLVQSDVEDWNASPSEEKGSGLLAQFALSNVATSPEVSGMSDVSLVLWSGVPGVPFPAQDPDFQQSLTRFLTKDALLFTRGMRKVSVLEGENEKTGYTDSALMFDSEGNLLFSQDQVYLPFPSSSVFSVSGDFLHGEKRSVFVWPNLPPFVVSVEDELLFSLGSGLRDVSVSWILNLVSRPRAAGFFENLQYLQQLQLRAVEWGLPIVRLSNRGPSVVIDPYGRVVDALPMQVRGVMDAELPFPVRTTVFFHFGNWIFCLILAVGVFFSLLGSRRVCS